MFTSSQEPISLLIKSYRVTIHRGPTPDLDAKLKHFPLVFLRVVKHTNTLQYLMVYYIFLFQLFNTCIENSEKTDDLDKRLQILLTNCTKSVYTNVAR